MRRVYERWARGDFSETDVFHPMIEFELADWPDPARSRGRDAMWRTWRKALSACTDSTKALEAMELREQRRASFASRFR